MDSGSGSLESCFFKLIHPFAFQIMSFFLRFILANSPCLVIPNDLALIEGDGLKLTKVNWEIVLLQNRA
jgi:hypothetical protein